ncbi:MAG: DNA internalization-related competence protein ComEC/Rec2 [bacterium]
MIRSGELEAPLFIPALAVVAGMGVFVGVADVGWFYGAIAVGTASLVAASICRYLGAVFQKISYFLLMTALGAASGAWYYVRVNTVNPDDLILAPPEGEVAVIGRIASFPVATRAGGYFEIDVVGIETSRNTLIRRKGQVRIVVGDEVWAGFIETGLPGPGAVVRCETTLSKPIGFMNPGGFDPAYHLESRGIHLTGYVKYPEFFRVLRESSSIFNRLGRFRLKALQLLDMTRSSGEWLPERLRDDVPVVAKALLLGSRGELSPDAYQVFQQTGLVHVLAVSGLHVGIIAGLALWILKRIPGDLRSRSAALILIVWCYALLAGAGSSIIRASVMVSAMMISQIVYRPAHLKNVVSLAAIALLFYRPAWIGDPGFQLTFTATGGIALLYPGLKNKLKWIRPIWLQDGLAVSIAAQSATAPVSAYWFNRIGFVSALAGLPLIPLVSIAMMTGVAALSLAFIPVLGPILLRLHGLSVALLVWGADRETGIPGITLTPSTPTLWTTLAAAGLLIVLSYKDVKGFRISAACLIVPFLFIVKLSNDHRNDGKMDIWFLDVGNGDCTVVRLPDSTTMVIDAGGILDSDYDIGEKVVIRALRTIGIENIDVAVITHPHPDHQLGMKAVMAHLKPQEFWVMNSSESQADFLEIIEQARRHKISIKYLEKRDIFRVFPLSENNRSAILGIRYGSFRVLLPGDAEREAEAAVLDYGLYLKSDILKIGHHGSRSSCSPEFIEAVSPQAAVIPCGRRNQFGHPHAETLHTLTHTVKEIRIFRSDIHGMVHVATDGSTAEIRWLAMEQ